jgi:hypothetical protein
VKNGIKYTIVNGCHYRNSLLSNILMANTVSNKRQTVNVRADIVAVRSKEQICGPLIADNAR